MPEPHEGRPTVPLDTLYCAETPEGIALSLRPAGLMSRALAYLIDLGVRMGLLMLIATAVSVAGGMGMAIILISYFALEWFYPVLFELSPSGATPGKRAMGLQVVMDSGLPVTPAAAIVRNLLRAADFLPGLYVFGLLSLLCRSDFKRLGDMAAGTLVVYSETVVLHGQLPQAQPLAPARTLAQTEQASIIAWAARASRLTPARLEELAQLALPVCADHNTDLASPQLLGVAQWCLGRRSVASTGHRP